MWENELKAMIEAAYEAEKHIKKVYAKHFAVEIKADKSPVTEADKGADEIIRTLLKNKFADYGFLTEESADSGERLTKDTIFIVDPVDGTMEFVSKNGEFTTNIALCYKHQIVASVINVPMLDTLYYAVKGEGAYRLKRSGTPELIHVSSRKKGELRALMSRSFARDEEKELIESHKNDIVAVLTKGAANKFCAIASGEAEVFYRYKGGTKEWDTAAGDLLLTEAGGFMIKPDGTSYTYNREDVYNHDGYILLNSLDNRLD